MNALFALTFCGILALSFSASVSNLQCRNIAGKSDLDVKKYFNGRWYLTKLEKSDGPSDVCQESKSDVKDGIVSHKILSYYQGRDPEFGYIDCKTNVKEISDGKAVLNCNLKLKSEVSTFTLEGTVVETDYETFAIFYACGKDGDKVTGDNVLLLQRNKDIEETNPKIKETLKKIGLNLDDFTPRKPGFCKVDPDF
uniref:Venom triabin-like protein 1 n=1 Tax=Pristhesancus plagipennis TaxID=1955184 RepID=A0A1Q1NPL2_PRIPG|nr:venom triabin-like protein 1 [Pristhesancus plagipennis]